MNKTKIILAGIGGAVGLAVLTMAYFTWSSYSAKTAAAEGDDEEGVDGLETVMSKAESLSRKAVYPCAASLAAIESNQAAVVAWQKEATELATRGDRAFEKTTPAQFKTDIVNDAKRLATLPGGVAGKLVKPDFAFGPFKDFIAEGKMPAEAQLAELQRRWDDVATVVEILSTNGVAELVDVQFKAAAQDEAKKDRKDKRNPKDKKGKKAAASGAEPAAYTYVFTFATKPTGFVKVMNALAVAERFIAVDDFSFARPKDALAEELGDADKKAGAAQASGGRRGRRRGAVVEEKKDEEKKDKKGGIVTDPMLDAPLTVTLTATVCDFRSLEDVKAEEVKK